MCMFIRKKCRGCEQVSVCKAECGKLNPRLVPQPLKWKPTLKEYGYWWFCEHGGYQGDSVKAAPGRHIWISMKDAHEKPSIGPEFGTIGPIHYNENLCAECFQARGVTGYMQHSIGQPYGQLPQSGLSQSPSGYGHGQQTLQRFSQPPIGYPHSQQAPQGFLQPQSGNIYGQPPQQGLLQHASGYNYGQHAPQELPKLSTGRSYGQQAPQGFLPPPDADNFGQRAPQRPLPPFSSLINKRPSQRCGPRLCKFPESGPAPTEPITPPVSPKTLAPPREDLEETRRQENENSDPDQNNAARGKKSEATGSQPSAQPSYNDIRHNLFSQLLRSWRKIATRPTDEVGTKAQTARLRRNTESREGKPGKKGGPREDESTKKHRRR